MPLSDQLRYSQQDHPDWWKGGATSFDNKVQLVVETFIFPFEAVEITAVVITIEIVLVEFS
ncbi:MAG: hypothetical protein ACKVHE_16165 [Planctomycetales bacterium]|jgi:hypothetical protein